MSRPELGLDYPNCLHRLVLLSVNHVSFIGLFEPSFPAGCVSFYYSTFFSWTCLLQYFESFFLYWVLRKCQWHCSFIIVPFRWFHNGLFLVFLQSFVVYLDDGSYEFWLSVSGFHIDYSCFLFLMFIRLIKNINLIAVARLEQPTTVHFCKWFLFSRSDKWKLCLSGSVNYDVD